MRLWTLLGICLLFGHVAAGCGDEGGFQDTGGIATDSGMGGAAGVGGAAGNPAAGSGGFGGTGGTGGMNGPAGGSGGSGGSVAAPDAGSMMGVDAGLGGAPGDSEPDFNDPGTEAWEPVPEDRVAETCGLDPTLLEQADSEIATDYAVVRYGELCHEYYPSGSDSPAEVWSATKTLGALVTGIASYETREFDRNGPGTGQLRDTDRVDHWLDSFSFNQEAQIAHVLGMVAHNSDLSEGNRSYQYDTVGSTQINRLSDVVNTAIAQDPDRLGADIEEFTQRFLYDAIGMTDSTWSGGSSDKTYAYTWSTTLHDMARVGVLILHRGIWDGTRVLEQSWTYKMTHPSFEDANTAYGYLTWLNARTGSTGPGGSFSGTAGDPCAPAALWQRYPHEPSGVDDCGYGDGFTCEQEHDIGVWSAQGLGGQFIVGHPGLDLVIVAKNFSSGGGPQGLWEAVRPALVALDSTYAGDESTFCDAYGAGDYAPDLMAPRTQPGT